MGEDRQVILVCGPESSGKTTISKFIAKHIKARLLPDYSRFYLTAYSQTYTKDDVVLMAKIHHKQFSSLEAKRVVLDSFLLNYKIWLDFKFGYTSEWLDEQLKDFLPHKCLLMKPDLSWEKDSLRESETTRIQLFDLYEKELKKLNLPYTVINGVGQLRYINSKKALADFDL